jgi:hypothetical protein
VGGLECSKFIGRLGSGPSSPYFQKLAYETRGVTMEIEGYGKECLKSK